MSVEPQPAPHSLPKRPLPAVVVNPIHVVQPSTLSGSRPTTRRKVAGGHFVTRARPRRRQSDEAESPWSAASQCVPAAAR